MTLGQTPAKSARLSEPSHQPPPTMFHQLLVEEDMMTSEAVGSQTTSPYTTDQHTVGNLHLHSFNPVSCSPYDFAIS